MILRISRRIVSDANFSKYHRYLLQTELPARRAAHGNRGTYLFRQSDVEYEHCVVITLWDSHESIRRFLAAEVERSRNGPEPGSELAESEPHVGDYEFVSSGDDGWEEQAPDPRAFGAGAAESGKGLAVALALANGARW